MCEQIIIISGTRHGRSRSKYRQASTLVLHLNRPDRPLWTRASQHCAYLDHAGQLFKSHEVCFTNTVHTLIMPESFQKPRSLLYQHRAYLNHA